MAKVDKVKKVKLPTRTRPLCPDCGFRIRGDNHNEGIHHKTGGRGKYPARRF